MNIASLAEQSAGGARQQALRDLEYALVPGAASQEPGSRSAQQRPPTKLQGSPHEHTVATHALRLACAGLWTPRARCLVELRSDADTVRGDLDPPLWC